MTSERAPDLPAPFKKLKPYIYKIEMLRCVATESQELCVGFSKNRKIDLKIGNNALSRDMQGCYWLMEVNQSWYLTEIFSVSTGRFQFLSMINCWHFRFTSYEKRLP